MEITNGISNKISFCYVNACACTHKNTFCARPIPASFKMLSVNYIENTSINMPNH